MGLTDTFADGLWWMGADLITAGIALEEVARFDPQLVPSSFVALTLPKSPVHGSEG